MNIFRPHRLSGAIAILAVGCAEEPGAAVSSEPEPERASDPLHEMVAPSHQTMSEEEVRMQFERLTRAILLAEAKFVSATYYPGAPAFDEDLYTADFALDTETGLRFLDETHEAWAPQMGRPVNDRRIRREDNTVTARFGFEAEVPGRGLFAGLEVAVALASRVWACVRVGNRRVCALTFSFEMMCL